MEGGREGGREGRKEGSGTLPLMLFSSILMIYYNLKMFGVKESPEAFALVSPIHRSFLPFSLPSV